MRKKKQETFWQKYGFEIIFCSTLLFLMIMAFIRIDEKGSWSTNYYIPPKQYKRNKNNSFYTIDNDIQLKPKDSKGEIECRRVLETYFKRSFGKTRPDFLKNPAINEGRNLELDCYNDELKLAVEYNGIQHYKFSPYFHRTRDAFQNQKYRDYLKRQLCEKNGITLIEVPYTIQIKDIEKYLLKQIELKK